MTDARSQQVLTRREALAGFAFPWFQPKTIRLVDARFRVIRNGKSAWRFLHIHGDESTARDVLLERIATQKGIAFVVENDRRYVAIDSGRIDPNRMFSREGAEASLRRLNPQWRESQVINAMLALDQGREKFIRQILPPSGGILISLHNNGRSYSMRTEIPLSDRASVKDDARMFNFMLATDPRDFATMEGSPFNCVLQRNPPPPDDGSLSRLCAARGVRYVNIEAGLGDIEAQRAMLDWCLRNLPEKR